MRKLRQLDDYGVTDCCVMWQVVYYDNGGYSWEPGPNRSIKLSEVLQDTTPGAEPMFTCYWGHTPTTPVS